MPHAHMSGARTTAATNTPATPPTSRHHISSILSLEDSRPKAKKPHYSSPSTLTNPHPSPPTQSPSPEENPNPAATCRAPKCVTHIDNPPKFKVKMDSLCKVLRFRSLSQRFHYRNATNTTFHHCQTARRVAALHLPVPRRFHLEVYSGPLKLLGRRAPT